MLGRKSRKPKQTMKRIFIIHNVMADLKSIDDACKQLNSFCLECEKKQMLLPLPVPKPIIEEVPDDNVIDYSPLPNLDENYLPENEQEMNIFNLSI